MRVLVVSAKSCSQNQLYVEEQGPKAFMAGRGKAGGCLVNHFVFSARSKSFCLDILLIDRGFFGTQYRSREAMSSVINTSL